MALPHDDFELPISDDPVAPSDPTQGEQAPQGTALITLDSALELRPNLTTIPVAPQAPVGARKRVRQHAWPLVTAVLVVALAGSAFYGFSTNNRLTDTQKTLDTANATVAARDASLSTAQSQIGELQVTVNQTQAALGSSKTCIAAQEKDSADLTALYLAEVNLYNLTSKGSALATARDARDKALTDEAWNYLLAGNAVINGQYSSASTYLKRADTASKAADAALTKITSEVAKVNDAVTNNSIQDGILTDQLARTKTTCGFGSGSSGSSG